MLEARLKLQIVGCCGLLDENDEPDEQARCECIQDRIDETTDQAFPAIQQALQKCLQGKRDDVIEILDGLKGVLPWVPKASAMMGETGPGNEMALLFSTDIVEFSFVAEPGGPGLEISGGSVSVTDANGTLELGLDGTLELSEFVEQPDGSFLADVEGLDWTLDDHVVELAAFGANEAFIDDNGNGYLRVAVVIHDDGGWVDAIFDSVWMELPFTRDGDELTFDAGSGLTGTEVFPLAQAAEEEDYEEGGCEHCEKVGGEPAIFSTIESIIQDAKDEICEDEE